MNDINQNDETNLSDLQEGIDSATDSHDAVRLAGEYALRKLGATDVDKKKSGEEIVAYVYNKLRLSLPVSRNSFAPYLSRVVGSANSSIVSFGRGRGGGYYLSDPATHIAQSLARKEEGSPSVYNRVEEQLYPVFHRWFIGQGYNARVTASMRALGKWSNPDITGIKVSEHFGRFEIEISTIEAKKDLQDWERYFFEAVSHRRYANRAYFAFPLPESSQGKLPDEMRYYSELYNVGVLTVIFSDEDYKNYMDGQPIESPDVYVSDIVEVLAARSTEVPMVFQRRFCEALDIHDIQALLAWGDR